MSTKSDGLDVHGGQARPAHAASSTMQAIARDSYGSADELAVRDIARPVIAADEVLVRVHAAGLDRGAVHVMTGRPYLMRMAGFGVRRPKRPGLGSELAGRVEAVGREVTGYTIGDPVYGTGQSTFAQYAAAGAGTLAAMPANLSFEQASAVPVSGVTALQALLDHGRLESGQSVLVIGASGGVGLFAVQIAKHLGAQVTGVGSPAKLDFVRGLGADHVVDYTTGELTDGDVRYDLVIDIAGNRPVKILRRLLAPKGTLVFVGGEGGGPLTGGMGRQLRSIALSPFVGQRLGTPWVAKVKTSDLDTLRTMIESGAVTPAIDRVCRLSEIPAALRDLEAGRVRGKIVATTP